MTKLLFVLSALLIIKNVNAKPVEVNGFNIGMTYNEILSQIKLMNYVEHRAGIYKHPNADDPYTSGNRWVEFDTSINNVWKDYYIQLGCGVTETCHMNIKQVAHTIGQSLNFKGDNPNLELCANNISGDQVCVSKGLDGKPFITLFAFGFMPPISSEYITYQGFNVGMEVDEMAKVAESHGLVHHSLDGLEYFILPEIVGSFNDAWDAIQQSKGQWIIYDPNDELFIFGCIFLGCDSSNESSKRFGKENDDIETPKKILGTSLGQNLKFSNQSYIGTCATGQMGDNICIESGLMDGNPYGVYERVVILVKYLKPY